MGKKECRKEKKVERKCSTGFSKGEKTDLYETNTFLSYAHTHKLNEKLSCLSSFGIKFELNESADLPARQYMSNREH